MKSDTIRWGILSAGRMARTFAKNLRLDHGAELTAVASRAQERADAFADEFNIPHRYHDYTELAADADVDVVYIATPNSMHKEHTLMALESGKAVLCEKPFATNASEARVMIERAREKRVFLMEAMWTRFLPLMGKVRGVVAKGVLGDVCMLTADFGFRAAGDEMTDILMKPAFGGGSLLDVGVYAVSFASMVLGSPSSLATLADIGKTGVDEQAGMVFGYSGGQLALLHSSIRATTPQEATIMGTQRRVRIDAPFWCSSTMTLLDEDGAESIIEAPFDGDGYHFEAVEVMDCLRRSRLESAVMPLDESLEIMKTMDAIRGQWGLRYPADQIEQG